MQQITRCVSVCHHKYETQYRMYAKISATKNETYIL